MLDSRSKFGVAFRPWVRSFASASPAPGSSAASTPGPRASPARSIAGVSASSPQSAAARCRAKLGAERAYATSEELVQSDDVDVVHICTPNHLHAPLAEPRSPPASTSSARSRWRSTPPRPQRLVDAAAASGRVAAVPFVYRFYPTVREARERVRTRRHRPAAPRCTATTCRTGCCAPRTTTGASSPTSAARRARSPTSARTGATSPSSSPATASRACQRAHDDRGARAREGRAPRRVRRRRRRRQRRRRAPRGQHRGRRGHAVRDRRRRVRHRRHQPDLRRPQEPPVARARRRARGARVRPGASRDAVVRAPRGDDDRAPRRRAPVAAPPRGSRRCRPATPRATPQCFDRFVEDVYAAIARRGAATGCRSSPTACAPRTITDAVLASARERALGRRPRSRRRGGRRDDKPVLEVRGLVKHYPGAKALDGVDFDVVPGEVHCLLGPNGAGKSTLIKCVSGIVEPTAGEVLVDGEPLPAGDAERVARARRRDDLPGARPRRGPARLRVDLPRPREAPRPAARPRRDEARGARAARAPGPREHPGRRARPRAAPRRAAGRLDRPRAVARRSRLLDHGRAVGDPRRQRGRDALRRRAPPDRRGRRRRLHLAPPRRGPAASATASPCSPTGAPSRPACPPTRRATCSSRRWSAARSSSSTPTARRSRATTSSSRSDGDQPRARGQARRRFSVRAGEVLGIGGLVGAGRTELLRLIYGLDKPDAGEVRVDGKLLPPAARARRSPPAWAWRRRTASRRGCCSTGALTRNVTLADLGALLHARQGPARPRRREARRDRAPARAEDRPRRRRPHRARAVGRQPAEGRARALAAARLPGAAARRADPRRRRRREDRDLPRHHRPGRGRPRRRRRLVRAARARRPVHPGARHARGRGRRRGRRRARPPSSSCCATPWRRPTPIPSWRRPHEHRHPTAANSPSSARRAARPVDRPRRSCRSTRSSASSRCCSSSARSSSRGRS